MGEAGAGYEAVTDDDPNEAYEVEPIPEGQLMASLGWWRCTQNGIPQWYGPEWRMRELASDPTARAEARRSKKLHDAPPT